MAAKRACFSLMLSASLSHGLPQLRGAAISRCHTSISVLWIPLAILHGILMGRVTSVDSLYDGQLPTISSPAINQESTHSPPDFSHLVGFAPYCSGANQQISFPSVLTWLAKLLSDRVTHLCEIQDKPYSDLGFLSVELDYFMLNKESFRH